MLVSLGILASRVAGLVREVVFSAAVGLGTAADAFAAALKVPNLIQNLLGEGALSAAFIPTYSRLVDEGRRREADQLAGAVAAILVAVAGAAVLVFVAAAGPITRALTPGLTDDSFDLAVPLVQVMAIGVGFLVLSAWCLGVLNAHRRFFLSYAAPVLWNGAQIAVLVVALLDDWDPDDVIRGVAWGVVIGGVLQLAVQLPEVRRLIPELRLNLRRTPERRHVLSRFGPAVLGRGATQLSAFVDLFLASFAAAGAVGALMKGQLLFTLPLALFAMSVVASELPELSRLAAADPDGLVRRADAAIRRISFFMVGCAALYVAAGETIVGALFERGEFTSDDTVLVWFVVAAYGLGMPANGASRMLANTLYAVGDTKSPARIAVVRVTLDAVFTLLLLFNLDRIVVADHHLIGLDLFPDGFGPLPTATRELDGVVRLGAVGSALGSALAAWVELGLLRRAVDRRVEGITSPFRVIGRLALAAALAFMVAAAIQLAVDPLPALLAAPIVVGGAGFTYAVVAFRTGAAEAHLVLGPVRRAIWR